MSRTFTVGDIHGCDIPLLELLNEVNFDFNNDKLISLGDLCDRGPNTWEVFEILLKIKNLIFIKGNHDYCFEQYLKNNNDYIYDWGLRMGSETIDSYEKHKWLNIENHRKLLNSAVSYHVENNFCFVHGGFDRYRKIQKQLESFLIHDRQLMSDVMNNKDEKIFTMDEFEKIFIGHTPTLCWNEGDDKLNGQLKIVLSIDNPIYQPIIKSSVYNIDTGCGKGGPLTLYDVYNDKCYQSKEKYGKVPKMKWKNK
jgi:serine/threonine protein phosphatase 1